MRQTWRERERRVGADRDRERERLSVAVTSMEGGVRSIRGRGRVHGGGREGRDRCGGW